MQSNLVDLLVKFSGFGWVWDKIDGCKTYIQAAAEMLTGLGMMATAGAAELNSFTAGVHSIGDVFNFLQSLTKNPDPAALAFMAGWAGLLHGWGVMAKKHADDKRHEELLAAATPAVSNVTAILPATPAASAPAGQ